MKKLAFRVAFSCPMVSEAQGFQGHIRLVVTGLTQITVLKHFHCDLLPLDHHRLFTLLQLWISLRAFCVMTVDSFSRILIPSGLYVSSAKKERHVETTQSR